MIFNGAWADRSAPRPDAASEGAHPPPPPPLGARRHPRRPARTEATAMGRLFMAEPHLRYTGDFSQTADGPARKTPRRAVTPDRPAAAPEVANPR